MKNPLGAGNGMVPHYSGTTLDAQARYANGTKSILENYLTNKDQEPQVRCLSFPNLACVNQACYLQNIIVGKKGYETKAYGQR